MDYVHYLNKLVQSVEHSIKLRQLNWKKIHKLDELVQHLTMARFPKNFACEENTQTQSGEIELFWLEAAQLETGSRCLVGSENPSHQGKQPLSPRFTQIDRWPITSKFLLPVFFYTMPHNWSDRSTTQARAGRTCWPFSKHHGAGVVK